MAITRFFYALLVLSVVFVFYSKSNKPVEVKKDEKPTISFENSIMYEINTEKVSQVVQSQKANIYKGYEELYNASILSKSKNSVDKSNKLSAKHIVKIEDDIFLNGDVKFESYNDIIFESQQIHYNTKTDIAKNEAEFQAKRGDSIFKGENLLYDSTKNHIVAQNTHFKINIEDRK